MAERPETSGIGEDDASIRWAPWITPRRLILFLIAWLTAFAVLTILISNPFQSEPQAGVTPDYFHVMFMHGLLIGMVGLGALLALQVMRVGSLHLRVWISAGAVVATLLASMGGIWDRTIPGSEVPMWTQILGFFAFDEILILLAVGLAFEFLRSPAARNLAFVTAALASVSMLIAAVMGHLAGWIMEFGENSPSAIANYRSFAGFGSQDDFSAALVGSHSHEMAIGSMALVITLLAVKFGYQRRTGLALWVARAGMAMVATGVVLMSAYYIATGWTSWSPPGNLTTRGGTIPLDDTITGVLVMGGGVVIAAAFLRDYVRRPVRLAAGWSWVLSFSTVAVAGYTIELNTSYFGAGDQSAAGAASDAVFTWLHQDVGLFLLPTLVMVMLAVELLVTARPWSSVIGWLAAAGTTVLFIGSMVWVFVDPRLHGPGYVISTMGILLVGAALLVAIYWGAMGDPQRTPRVRAPALAHALRERLGHTS